MKFIKVENTSRTVCCDDEDFDRLSIRKWWVTNNTVVITKFPRNKTRSISTIVMNRKGVMFDHINRDIFDNRKCNLRECTPSQNNMNRKKMAGTSSKYKGVHWAKPNKKWKAKIVIHDKRIHLGYFENEEDAARAYDKAALSLFKEFANINFPSSEGNAAQSSPV